MPGTGKLVMTGQMGDVMKESAQIALTYVRSVSEQYSIDRDYFEKIIENQNLILQKVLLLQQKH